MSAKRTRFVVGNRSAWWNKQLTGKWMWGGLIGFGLSVLIAYQIARWLVVALLVLGCVFAVGFRFTRKDGEF